MKCGDCENWKRRGDELYDEQVRDNEHYNDLADRLTKAQRDNERLCKILIELGHGDRIEVEE